MRGDFMPIALIRGTAGDDTLYGTSGQDSILGLAGGAANQCDRHEIPPHP